MIISLMMPLILVDTYTGFLGGLSVSNTVQNINKDRKIAYLEKNHPKHLKDITVLKEDNIYLDEETGEITVIGTYNLIKLDGTQSKGDEKVIVKGYLNDTEVDILSFYGPENKISHTEETKDKFIIPRVGKTYEYGYYLMQNHAQNMELADKPDILEKGKTLKFIDTEEIYNIVNDNLRLENYTWIFYKDGEEVESVRVILPKGAIEIDLEEIPTLAEEGDWEVIITGKFYGVRQEILLSNTLKYTIE